MDRWQERFRGDAKRVVDAVIERDGEVIDATADISRPFVYKVLPDVIGLPVTTERIEGREGLADNLIVRSDAAASAPGILILSHIDTVHPIGTLGGRGDGI